MRLINTKTFELHEFFSENTPPYAILSHAWGDQEVTFQDWQNRQQVTQRDGYTKIVKACSEALNRNLEWLWVDTNCIDKSSSAELSEAINSMFAYYQKSEICFAYLVDVPTAKEDPDVLNIQIEKSRWFTRGWTLQELIAPKSLIFYAADWSAIGRKDKFALVSIITNIDAMYLSGESSIHEASVAKRMSWLAKRTTTRAEDMAYCMLGIFGINMPLLYGEGKTAFFRLQQEIIKTSNDHTIFCWGWNEDVPKNWASFLAPWPTTFEGAGKFRVLESDDISVFSMSNAGLSIQLPIDPELQKDPPAINMWLVKLQATSYQKYQRSQRAVCIRVVGCRVGDLFYVARFPYPPQPMGVSANFNQVLRKSPLLVMNKLSYGRLHGNQGMNKGFYHGGLLRFVIVGTWAVGLAEWYCATSYGCSCEPDQTGHEFEFRLHDKGKWWAAVIMGKIETHPQTRICILLGGKLTYGSQGISVRLMTAQWDCPRLSQGDKVDIALQQWMQQIKMSDHIILPVAFESTLGIGVSLRESGGNDRHTYNLCLYKDQFGSSV
ncbi:hypothetical protein FLONG3_5763 [Fusarium longipes]|uniref:Heterokaryon incompatibility domain-containing protein n=1 Tax=Fusarium longipes TaxID=694270 RepID=A0A395STI9_9HYPO|nr:hypothetical protein FLONG3_5763 [Fusarium longipes]